MRCDIAVNYLLQTGLIYRHLACLQCFDFLQVVIDANNVMADIRKTCAGNKTDITRTDDCEIHKKKTQRLSRGTNVRSNLGTSTSCAAIVHWPSEVGSKFRSTPNFGNAFSVTENKTPYSFTPLLSRITPPIEATQLVRSR